MTVSLKGISNTDTQSKDAGENGPVFTCQETDFTKTNPAHPDLGLLLPEVMRE